MSHYGSVECVKQETSTDKVKTSKEVLLNLEQLSDYAKTLSCRINDQLQDICTPIVDKKDNNCLPLVNNDYPIYFANIQNGIDNIQASLTEIGVVLDRCEL